MLWRFTRMIEMNNYQYVCHAINLKASDRWTTTGLTNLDGISSVIHLHTERFSQFCIIRPRRSRSAAAYSHQTFPCTICLSVGRSVCPVHCGKTADRIRQPFGTIGRTGPRMSQVLGFGNRSTGRGTFGGEFEPHHCNQWGLYVVRVRQCLNRRRCGLGWCLRWAEALLY